MNSTCNQTRSFPRLPKHFREKCGKYRRWIFFTFSCLALFFGFAMNAFRAASDQEYLTYGQFSEGMVLGRLSETQKHGLFSDGGFMGYAVGADSADYYLKQQEIYEHQLDYKRYSVYRTISGFSGFIFGLVDSVTGFSNHTNLKLFRMVSAMLASAAISLLLIFILHYSGITAWAVAFASAVCSISLTAFGSNLYFSVWAFYVPFIVMAWLLRREEAAGKYSARNAALMIFIGITIKCQFNGMEFITASMIMLLLPVVFFAVKNRWKRRLFYRRFLNYSLIAMAGVIFNLGILAAQNSIYLGSWKSGPEHIYRSFLKRTTAIGAPKDFKPEIRESLKAKWPDVIKFHLGSAAYREPSDILNLKGRIIPVKITYGHIVLWMGIATLLLLLVPGFRTVLRNHRADAAMLVTAWVSLLAPFSWLIIFKGHAYIHKTLVSLAWYLPYVIFAAAVAGITIKTIATAICAKIPGGFFHGRHSA